MRLWNYPAAALRALIEFRQPLQLLVAYLRVRPLDQLITRNGIVLRLTGCAHDPKTTFLVWCRREYDPLPAHGTVIDVGANFGAFSVYCAARGLRVIAIEPNSACVAALRANAQGWPVSVERAAVWRTDGEQLEINVRPHPGNSVIEHWPGETELVMTTTIESIMRRHDLDVVDLLKLDCEGAEYDILRTLPDECWQRIREIVIEFHAGAQDIPHLLAAHGFRVVARASWRAWGREFGLVRATARPTTRSASIGRSRHAASGTRRKC